MAAITWQVRLQMEVLESAKQHLQDAAITSSEMTLNEAIQKAAQECMTKYSKLPKELSEARSHINWAVGSLSKMLSTQKKLTPEKAKELVSLRDKSQNTFFTEDEDEFVLVDTLESRMEKILELLKSWEKNPSQVI